MKGTAFGLGIAGALVLALGGGCGMNYIGVVPTPYPKDTCEAKGCAWNPAKAHCECWNRPNPDGRNVEKGANF